MAMKDFVAADVPVVEQALNMLQKSFHRRVNAESDPEVLKIWQGKLDVVNSLLVKLRKQ